MSIRCCVTQVTRRSAWDDTPSRARADSCPRSARGRRPQNRIASGGCVLSLRCCNPSPSPYPGHRHRLDSRSRCQPYRRPDLARHACMRCNSSIANFSGTGCGPPARCRTPDATVASDWPPTPQLSAGMGAVCSCPSGIRKAHANIARDAFPFRDSLERRVPGDLGVGSPPGTRSDLTRLCIWNAQRTPALALVRQSESETSTGSENR